MEGQEEGFGFVNQTLRPICKNKKGNVVMTPQIIIDYNTAKGAVDLSDQIAAYSSSLRKSVKWYRVKHTLEKKDGLARKVRRTCRQCYAENVPIMGSKQAKTKTTKVLIAAIVHVSLTFAYH